MENFAQLHFYGQIHKNSSRIRILSENYRIFSLPLNSQLFDFAESKPNLLQTTAFPYGHFVFWHAVCLYCKP